MKKKCILTIAFVISLLPMLFNQYGGMRGVQEITGLINLTNPIGIISVFAFSFGIWFPFKKQIIGKVLGFVGTVGIALSEIYNFLTWYIQNITGKFSLKNSFNFVFPEFYVGLAVSIIMVAIYFWLYKKLEEKQ